MALHGIVHAMRVCTYVVCVCVLLHMNWQSWRAMFWGRESSRQTDRMCYNINIQYIQYEIIYIEHQSTLNPSISYVMCLLCITNGAPVFVGVGVATAIPTVDLLQFNGEIR